MFSFLAWPRVIFFTLILSRNSYAREESLFTSSVTYCNPPETLLIQRFEVAYFPSNTSVSFNVSVSSVEPNVNVSANIFLNVYGMKPVNITLDLCNILKGAICPLPMYNFTGADSIQLPSKLAVSQRIPQIAFKIPDLEGFAQLTLMEVKTGKVKACVQATLNNGWSAHQEGVEWTTCIVALAAFLAAFVFSILPFGAVIPLRFLELIYLYQSIASSSLLSLNYPSLYRAFTLNFSWSLGLISPTNSPVQQGINRMRYRTGGQLSGIGDSAAVGFVNRKLSPFNNVVQPTPSTSISLSSSLFSSSSVSELARTAMRYIQSGELETVKGDVQTVTANSSNVLQAGVPIYVNLIGIATTNAFMTVFIVSLCLLAISLVIVGSAVTIVRWWKSKNGKRLEFDYRSFVISWLLCLALVVAFPLLIFVFYQWSLKDSWLSILLSVFSFLVILATMTVPSFLIFRFARTNSPHALFHNPNHISRFGCLYASYRPERYWFFAPLLVALFLRALFITVARESPPAQLALLITVELGLVLAFFILKPAKSRRSHVFTTYLAFTRFVCTAMMVAFLEALQVMAIPRVVIGIVIALVWSACVLVVIGNIVWNIILAIRRRERTSESETTTSPVSSDGSTIEKGLNGSGGSSTSTEKHGSNVGDHNGSNLDDDADSLAQVARARPVNPTPEHNVPLDPAILQPYPISPTATLSTMDSPSYLTKSSGTMTVGSLLPRRWSANISQPVTPVTPLSSNNGHSSNRGQRASSTSSHHDGVTGTTVSRNTSLKAQQQRYENIKEENEGSPGSST